MKAHNFRPDRYLKVLLFSTLIFTCYSCEDDPLDRDRFIGSYTVEEEFTSIFEQDTDTLRYNLIIQASIEGEDKVTLYNLNNTSQIVIGTAIGSKLDIPTQEIFDLTFDGVGTLTGTLLTITYTVSTQSDNFAYTAYCTRK